MICQGACKYGSHRSRRKNIDITSMDAYIANTGGFCVAICCKDIRDGDDAFFKRRAYNGLIVEPVKSSVGTFALNCPGSIAVESSIDPSTVADMLTRNNVPTDFDVLRIEMVGHTMGMMEAVLDAGWQPKVVIVEVNESVHPSIAFDVPYVAPGFWARRNRFYGGSPLILQTYLDKPAVPGHVYGPIEMYRGTPHLVTLARGAPRAEGDVVTMCEANYYPRFPAELVDQAPGYWRTDEAACRADLVAYAVGRGYDPSEIFFN